MNELVCLSVCLSVCPSVRLSVWSAGWLPSRAQVSCLSVSLLCFVKKNLFAVADNSLVWLTSRSRLGSGLTVCLSVLSKSKKNHYNFLVWLACLADIAQPFRFC
jgi:hypothetical protein